MEVNPLLIDIDSRPLETDARLTDKGARPSPPRSRRVPEPFSFRPTTFAPLRSRWYPPWKTATEWAIALALVILTAPLVLLASLLVKLTSRGPAFYSQTRMGRNGRLFTIYKIRTMVHDCESLTGPRWSMPEDPRVTRVGQLLRKTHLDELPQLLNVLRGEMGLIGPRPERPEFVPRLERVLPLYRERLAVRPGITGLAQVHFGPDTDVESVRRKLTHDLYYIQHLRPWLDLRILVATVFYALGNPLGLSRKIAAVPPGEVVECPLLRDRAEDEEEKVQKKLCA